MDKPTTASDAMPGSGTVSDTIRLGPNRPRYLASLVLGKAKPDVDGLVAESRMVISGLVATVLQ
jgi:hypothetical protein